MAELFEFGLDFGLSYFEPIPQKKSVTQEEYQKGKIDYYDQTLGALGGDFKIPERADDDEDRKDININVVGSTDTDDGDSSLPSIELTNPSANLYNVDIKTYGDALSEKGFGDKTPFNVFGTDIYLGGVPKTKEEAKKGLERLISKDSAIRQAGKLAGRFVGADPFITNTALAFATGRTVNDPFGNPSFRPSNLVLGGVHDINMSIQYDNVAQMKAALNTTGPKGFATYVNGQLVTRPPKGFNYTGTYDVPREMMQRIDAISKGIVPSTFDYRTESGDSGVKDGVGGMYDERGGYHDRNGSYAFGSRKASQSLADKYGMSVTKVEDILSKVRSDKTKTLSQELKNQIVEDSKVTTVDQIPDFDAYAKAQKERRQQIESGDSGLSEQDTDTGGYDPDAGFTAGEEDAFKTGGKVGQGMQAGGPAGFIGGPPENYSDQTTIADDIPIEVPEGAFVINAPAVEYAGSDDISEMLVKAYEKAGQGVDKSGRTTTIPSREQVDIMISRGEVVVPPNIAKIIGYDRLEKINNRGKKEVARRKKQGDQEKPQARQANSGGFMNQGGLVTIDDVKFKSFYSDVVEARNVIDKSLRSLPLADALAMMMYQEANVLGEKGLEGVVHVLQNRAEAEGYKDFGNSIIDELTKRNYNKDPKLRIFQFNGLEPTKFRKTLKVFKQDKKTYNRIRKIADEVLQGFREDFTGGATFFKNPKDSTEEGFADKVASGEFVETNRSKKVKTFQHIYYRPKDLGVVEKPMSETQQGFINIDPNVGTRPKVRIPESRGGSFIFRGSDYERGGASPAF
tara:strand:+ start:51 stop:2438 length:2388 start_codon:yes stop_codon:yes gene_type:complete